MRLLICGGRDYTNREAIAAVIGRLTPNETDVVIHGAARGADMLADDAAFEAGVTREPYYAAWELYGKSAGYKRNVQMLEEGKPDIVVAFPGGKGTQNMIDIAKRAGVPVLLGGR